MEDHQGIGSLNFLQRLLDRLDQVQIPGIFIDEMGHDLRIGFRRKVMPFSDELIFQLQVVLDDPVVDQGDLSGHMGVGIGFRRPPMGSPAGMADTDSTDQGLTGQDLPQLV